MKEKHGFVFHIPAGQNKTIFMQAAVSAGQDIWKAFVSYAKQDVVKPSGAKDIEDNIATQYNLLIVNAKNHLFLFNGKDGFFFLW